MKVFNYNNKTLFKRSLFLRLNINYIISYLIFFVTFVLIFIYKFGNKNIQRKLKYRIFHNIEEFTNTKKYKTRSLEKMEVAFVTRILVWINQINYLRHALILGIFTIVRKLNKLFKCNLIYLNNFDFLLFRMCLFIQPLCKPVLFS